MKNLEKTVQTLKTTERIAPTEEMLLLSGPEVTGGKIHGDDSAQERRRNFHIVATRRRMRMARI
jgi:hypothetical protein